MNIRNAAILASSVLAAVAQAQTASSFHAASLTGLTTTSTAGLTYDVSLASSVTMVYDNKTYHVTDIFGVFDVATAGGFSAATAKTTPSGWAFSGVSKNKTADLVGWTDNNKKNDIVLGGSQTFAFSLLTPTSGTTAVLGYHVRVSETLTGGGNTLYVYNTNTGGGSHGPAPVPEPASLATLGLGAAGLFRRKFGRR